jgi:hypothetical protein
MLHVLNALVGSLCISILGLATNSIVVKDRVDGLIPSSVKSTGMRCCSCCASSARKGFAETRYAFGSDLQRCDGI